MAESIVYNNATYIIPDVGESNWGQNLTNYFVAIPQGAYQASGGTMPLTADLSFGTNFGLFSKYVTSVTSTPATAGVIRLAKTDAVEWRNNANGANLALAIDSSDNLLWNGDIIATSGASPVLSITGTANEITASAATGNVTLSVPSTFIAPGSIQATSTLKGTAGTLTNTTNQIILGTTNTVTLSSTAPASSRIYTFPDAGGAANVVLDSGNYTIAGTWAFSNTITLGSSKAVIFTDNSTNAVTLKASNSTTSWTLNLPTTHGSSNQFLQTDGSGNTTWANGGAGTVTSGTAGNLSLYPATAASVNDTYVQNTKNITLGIATQAARSVNLAITIPNPGNAVTAASVVLTEGTQTINAATTMGALVATLSANMACAGFTIQNAGVAALTADVATYGQMAVKQVVIGTTATAATSTSASYADTNLTATITPKFSSSRILIYVAQQMDGTVTGAQSVSTGGLQLLRTASVLVTNANACGQNEAVSAGNTIYTTATLLWIDSPGTTSATTYKTQFNRISGGDGTVHVQTGSANTSMIVLMEIV